MSFRGIHRIYLVSVTHEELRTLIGGNIVGTCMSFSGLPHAIPGAVSEHMIVERTTVDNELRRLGKNRRSTETSQSLGTSMPG